jgi:Ser/Thr protein kinase RdoA (MazF antagonist)
LFREELLKRYERQLLNTAGKLFALDTDQHSRFASFEGCANLVYECRRQDIPVILRVSYRPDRSLSQIRAELEYVRYLADHDVKVAVPIPSVNGKDVETLVFDDHPLQLVCFSKGIGMRVPDNGYRYREDVTIEEYFQNWGAMLGKMHALSKLYKPETARAVRPEWFTLHAANLDLDQLVPAGLDKVYDNIKKLLEEIAGLPREADSFGLIHGDFNDGNFTVDYQNGDMTVFDFDDCCYFWFVYELASAWEGGIGRTMFADLDARRTFMDHYMDQVLGGYARENVLPDVWLDSLPLFIRLIQVEEFLYFAQYDGKGDPEIQAELDYKVYCLERELPYMGFFDPIYSPEHPFSLEL